MNKTISVAFLGIMFISLLASFDWVSGETPIELLSLQTECRIEIAVGVSEDGVIEEGVGGYTNPAVGYSTGDSGELLTITAYANAGYEFSYWEIYDTQTSSRTESSNPVSITYSESFEKLVMAVFIESTATPTPTISPTPSASPTPTTTPTPTAAPTSSPGTTPTPAPNPSESPTSSPTPSPEPTGTSSSALPVGVLYVVAIIGIAFIAAITFVTLKRQKK